MSDEAGGGPQGAAGGGGAGGGPGSSGLSIIGEMVQHVAAGQEASAEFSAVEITKDAVDVNILSPSKVPVSYR